MGLVLASTLAFSGTLTISLLKDTLYEITSDVENKRVEEIKEAVKGANERLADFSITREGNLITLGFSMWTGGDKVEFNLVGKKPDYYRMAMGVSIEDTLKELAKSDKRIAPVSASKDSETINLTIMFGEGGKPPTLPKPPKPARVSAKELSKAAPAKAAPPKPAPPTKNEDGMNTEDAEWQRIKNSGSTAEFEKFLKTYPKSMHKYAAKRKISELATRAVEEHKKEEAAVKQLAAEAKKQKAEQKRLKAEKQKRLKAEEQKRIKAEKKRLAKQKKRDAENKKLEAKKKKQKELELAAKKVTDAFKTAKKAGTSKALDKFVKSHPKSKHVADAKKLAEAKRDDEAFQAAKGSLDAMEGYLRKYPKGRHAKEANGLVEKLLSSGPLRLRVPSVKKAPKVDGKSDDAVWKNVRPLTVSLKREGKGAHIPKATIKAVHSGGKIYILAQWKDKSHDSEYRPYAWDEKAKKHKVTDKMDDGFAVAVYKGKATVEACMLTAKSHEVDLWVWRAYLSGISGLASDQSLVTSRDRMRKSTPHLLKNGSGQIWVRNLPDKGRLGWQYVVPLPDAPHKAIPSYKAVRASGSAADVSARGSWNKGVWTVEFSRALKTGNPDDADISAKGQVMVSFAAYDKADRQNHSSGKLVRLELQR